MSRTALLTLTCAALLGALALLPASALAGADLYYAAPSGATSGSACKNDEAKPCTMKYATELAKNGDHVVLLPGTYAIAAGGFTVGKEISIGGKAGAAASTVLKQAGSESIREPSTNKADLHDVTVEGAGGIQWSSGLVERVFVNYTGIASACALSQQLTMVDSVCWDHGTSSGSAALDADVISANDTITLRNVTAYATAGHAIFAVAQSGGELQLAANDVIAHSESQNDVTSVLISGGTSVNAVFEHSSFKTVEKGPGTKVTAVSEIGNTTAVPTFVNTAAGDFHQVFASTGIDAGAITSKELEEGYEGEHRLDLDGHPRVQAKCLGGAPVVDLGAYEAAPVDCSAPPGPPDNKFRFGKQKLNRKRGTASLTVIIPGPGTLKLTGKGLRSATWTAKGAGSVKLPVVSAGKAKRSLVKTGTRKVAPKVTFTPTGGSPFSQTHSLVLHRKLP